MITVLRLNESQRMALVDIVSHAITCAMAPEIFYDCSSPGAVATRPTDLLRLLLECSEREVGDDATQPG